MLGSEVFTSFYTGGQHAQAVTYLFLGLHGHDGLVPWMWREGVCGACTVLVDGDTVRSCITRIETLKDKKITTIEGLEKGGKLHPIQEAFLEEEAFQCGYCTSGMLMSSVALLDKNEKPSEADIVQHMNGNICRCGVYPRIIKAIKSAAVNIAKG
jgi:aerobic-type carbon monoxide dehydrogenase small subunit (CoxS/CutS family)